MRSIVRIGLVLMLVLGSLGGLTVNHVSGTGEGAEEAENCLDLFITYDISSAIRNGYEYDRLTIDGGGIETGERGEEVPFVTFTFSIHGSLREAYVDFKDRVYVPAEPVPAMAPVVLGEESLIDGRWKGAAEIEMRTDWSLIEIGSSDGDHVYSLKIRPMDYREGAASIHRLATLRYSVDERNTWSGASSNTKKPVGDIDYLIITNKDLEEAVEPLAEWKTQKGLFTLVYTTEEIEELYDTGDLAAKMRHLVMDLEGQYDLEYLLLAGDYDLVPTRNTHNEYPASMYGEPSNFATDGYFACVDSGTSWNKDGDSRYGEYGEIDDVIPDLAVGRLAINDGEVMAKKVSDLVSREKNLTFSKDMPTSIHMAGDNGQNPGDSREIMEFFWEEYINGSLRGRETIYYDNSGTMQYSKNSFKEAVDEKSQVMGYFSHGQFSGIPNLFDKSDVQTLSDNGPDGMLFAMACLTGWFDRPTGGMISGPGDCFAEALTEEPGKGLVGYMGASRLAVGNTDTSYDGDAPGLQQDYYRAVRKVMDGKLEPAIGAIYRDAITSFASSFHPFPNSQYDGSKRTYMEYNLLGEPDQPLILSEPGMLRMEYSLSPDRSSVHVKVINGSNEPVEGAVVTVSRLEELGVKGRTDGNGESDLEIPPSNGGTITITAYRQGDIPDQDTFRLQDELAPSAFHSIFPSKPDGRNGYYRTPPNITVFGDEEVKVLYRWDDESEQEANDHSTITAPEGNHTLSYMVVDPAGHCSGWCSFNISVDGREPKIVFELEPPVPNGRNGIYRTCPEITIDSDEPILEAEYSMNGGPFISMDEGIGALEGKNEIEVRISDPAGNIGKGNVSFTVDSTSPLSTLGLSHFPDGENGWYVTPPRMDVRSDDPASYGEYRWNDGDWDRYGEPITAPEGVNILSYRSVDQAGNAEEERTVEFKVDTRPPEMRVFAEPSEPDGLNGFYLNPPIFKVEQSDGKVTYLIIPMDGDLEWTGPASTYANELLIPDGEWTLQFRTVDDAGNHATSEPLDIKVDTEAPVFDWIISPHAPQTSTGWYLCRPEVSVSTAPSDSHLFWKDGAMDEWKSFEGSIELGEGTHFLELKGCDIAGNEYLQVVGEVKVDLEDPHLNLRGLENGSVFGPGDITIDWDAWDSSPELTYHYILDSGEWLDAKGEENLVFSNLKDGHHRFGLKTTDEAGRTAVEWRDFNIDITGPRIMSISPSGMEVGINTNIEVLFSEEVDSESIVVRILGVPGEVQWYGDRVIFRPYACLEYGTTYTVDISGTDTCGNEIGFQGHSFTTYRLVIENADDNGGDEDIDITPLIAGISVISLVLGIGATLIVFKTKGKKGREST
ncbi:MAG: C25 family cysteine peptidase [Thermoplasmatota archaeon]